MNSLFRPTSRLLTLLAALVLLGTSARARDDDGDSGHSTARAQFSDPAKPGTLKLSLPWAEARITATDGKEIVVTSTLDQKGRAEVDHEGFRRLDEDVTFELVEKDNVAVISIAGDNMWAAHGAEFEIKVPRSTNLILRTQAGGDIEVDGVQGDLDITSMNGDIVLRDIGSSAVVSTMNGEISATFKSAPTKAVSLSSMNGEIDLRLPSDTKANLHMRTTNGSIRTNFPDGVLKAKTEKTVRVSADARPSDMSGPVLTIHKNGDYTVDEDSTPLSLEELQKFARTTAAAGKEVSVRVRSEAGTDQKYITAALESCHKAGLTRVRFESDVSADARPDPTSRDLSREMAREAARMDREHAKIAREVAKAVAEANQIAASVTAALDGGGMVPPVPPVPPIPPLPNFGGKSIVGTLNGGGVDIKLTSVNGTITLRENK